MKKILAIFFSVTLLMTALLTGISIGKNAPIQAHNPQSVPHSDADSELLSPSGHSEALNPASGSTSHSAPTQLLNISARVVSDRVSIFQTEELNGNIDQPLMYSGLKDVTIEIDGNSIKLEDAIRDGHISLAEIFAYARTDAENGFCEVSIRSKNGLSSFLYSYPEYDLKLVYDVYETPDNELHLISDMALFNPGGESQRIYLNESSKILDLEDWGISLEVIEAGAEGITLSCTQSGGQQVGILHAYAFRLIQDGKFMAALDGDTASGYEFAETVLGANGTAQFSIDWKDIYGALSPGEYVIRVLVKDIYDENQVHPLMRNFYDIQHYEIPFTVQ